MKQWVMFGLVITLSWKILSYIYVNVYLFRFVPAYILSVLSPVKILQNFDFFLLSIKLYMSIITLRVLQSIEVAALSTCGVCADWKWPTYASRQALCGFFLRNWINLCYFWLRESNFLATSFVVYTYYYLPVPDAAC